MHFKLTVSDFLSRGAGGGARGLRPTKLSLTPQATYLLCLRLGPVVGSWRGTHLRSLFISLLATSFLCPWRSKGQNPHR